MTTALLVKNTCTLIFSPFQETPGFYVKVQGEEAPEGSQILGTTTIEPAGARGQPAIDKKGPVASSSLPTSCSAQALDLPLQHEPHYSGAPQEQ